MEGGAIVLSHHCILLTTPCNDIYWWRSMYTIKNIVHWRGSTSRIEMFVYV